MNRAALLDMLRKGECFDLLVVGGGATGCGVALDAASRGLKVALVEKGDFASGTSGRSTKLIHGGVRYLEAALLHWDRVQFNLVHDALRERGILLRIAPHLTGQLTLLVPLYQWLKMPYVYAGLTVYDVLAGRAGLGLSRLIGRDETLRRAPMLRRDGLKGAVLFRDGQFNDARMNLAVALTAIRQGAAVANYLEVVQLLKEEGRVTGARVKERFGGDSFDIRARCVVNACGPSSDAIRHMDDPAAERLLTVSSGIHIVLDRAFAPREEGITIPKTEDGRVLFILPWQGHCLVGTTDQATEPCDHPEVDEADIAYLLRHLSRYLGVTVERGDVKAVWAGLRPLLRDAASQETARLARDHLVATSPSGLVTIVGGKWTTYRKMAQDTVDHAVKLAGLRPPRDCRTESIVLHGGEGFTPVIKPALVTGFGLAADQAMHLHRAYGDQAEVVARLCQGDLQERLVAGHPYLKGEVLYAVRCELALRAADFLARRTPLALLDNRGAKLAAPAVLELMARELCWDGARLAEEREELDRRLNEAL